MQLSKRGTARLQEMAKHWTAVGESLLGVKDVSVIRSAAEREDVEACFLLALHLRKIEARESNSWLKKAAKAEHPKALCLLAEGIPDEGEAMPLLERAAQAGEVVAQRRLGCLHMEIGDDFKAGFHWLKRAADRDDPEALLRLAACYRNNLGTTGNQQMADQCVAQARLLDPDISVE
jgi:TPR repeat protein